MTAPLAHDVIQSRSRNDGGQKVTEQFVTCTVEGCDCEMVTKVTKTLKPGDVVLNMARRRGWHILNDGRKTRLCPTHNTRVTKVPWDEIVALGERFKRWFECKEPLKTDRRNALVAALADLGIDKVTAATNVIQQAALVRLFDNPSLNLPECAVTNMPAAEKTLMPLSESLKLPSDAARAQRRKVFHEIEECYGDRQYQDGFSDNYVATKLTVPVTLVAEIREMNFGPAGPDPRIGDLRKQVAALETRIGQIEDAALAVVDQAEKKAVELRRDIASLLDRINKLEGVL